MNKNDLKALIQPMIAEEVQKQLPKILFEMLKTNKPMIESVNNNTNKVVNNTARQPQQQVRKQVPQQPPQPKKMVRYVSDPTLNQIMNETSGLTGDPYGSLAELADGGFNNIGVNLPVESYQQQEILSENVMMPPQPQMNASHNSQQVSMMQEEQIYEEEPEPASSAVLGNLFKKNFKAILDKSKTINTTGLR